MLNLKVLLVCVHGWGLQIYVCEDEQSHVCLCMQRAEINVFCLLQPLQLIAETKALSEGGVGSPIQLDWLTSKPQGVSCL